MAVIAEFGAYSPDRMSGSYNPGYEVTPTLYLTDDAGRILWHDGQARPKHLKDGQTIVAELTSEIEKALAAIGEAPPESDATE